MALDPDSKKEDFSVHSKSDAAAEEPKEEAEVTPQAAYFQLWSFATPFDVFLRVLAALCSAGSGTAEPIMAIVFGNLVDLFNGSDVSPAEFRRKVNQYSLYFLYLFIGKFAVSPPFDTYQFHTLQNTFPLLQWRKNIILHIHLMHCS